jgi:glycerol-3-phosphate dehydrogenase subunit B
MAIESDVLVIGGGLAGRLAAIAAARTGVDTRLVTHKESTLSQASGLVDVLGYPPDYPRTEGPIADPFEVIGDIPEGHPYGRVGIQALRDGLTVFDDVVEEYCGGHTDVNALLPTPVGGIKPTARYPASMRHGLASDPRETLLIGFDGLTGFDAPLASAHLDRSGVPFEVRGVTVPFPATLRADAGVTRIAQLLDRNVRVTPEGELVDEAASAGSRPLRAALADRIASEHDGEARIGLPAVLGTVESTAVRESLADRLDADIFEIPSGPPSLPGMRLAARLDTGLEQAGVRTNAGNPVVGYETTDDGDRISTVSVRHAGGRTVPYAADQFVLATGGLVGKGIDSDRETVREPIFDCHVPHPTDRYDWFDDDAFGDHPFARFGVDVDSQLRPRTATGSPEYTNLRAVGSVLGGSDFAAENSGSGISIATGYAAGHVAGTEAR